MTDAPIELVSRSEGDTRRVGECLAAALSADDRAIVVALEGELGAGKTRLVRGLAGGLGVDVDGISSPSYVLLVEHKGTDAALVHMDAWRLRSLDELDALGFDELLARPRCVVAIEWPSKIAAALPEERIDVVIESTGEFERSITVSDRRGASLRARTAAALALFTPTVSTGVPRCSTCGRDIAADVATFPFCSSRCRMADLGRWFGGAFRLSRPAQADEELSE